MSDSSQDSRAQPPAEPASAADPSQNYRDRPKADTIPCPFILSRYQNEDLVPDATGRVSVDQLEDTLARVGLGKKLREMLAHAVEKADDVPDSLNIFELHDTKIDHTGSTGIRDPYVDPDQLGDLLRFGPGGRMYRQHFAAAADHFRRDDPGLAGGLAEAVEFTALLEVFGRLDKNGERYLTHEDLEGLWLHGRYPKGWQPRPRDSISTEYFLFSAWKTRTLEHLIALKDPLRLARFAATVALLGYGFLVVVGQIATRWGPVAEPELPPYEPVDVVYLDQGWTEDDAQWYWHASQGGSMELPIPYDWFLYLEQPRIPLSVFGEVDPVMDPVYMSRMGFLPNSKRSYDVAGLSEGWAAPAGLSRLGSEEDNNPDRVPIGFVRTLDYPDRAYNDGEGRVVPEVMGLNCSMCHTGQLNYQGTGIRIEGGSATVELRKLQDAVGKALGLTLLIPTRFDRFAIRVLGSRAEIRSERSALKDHMKDIVGRGQYLDETFADLGTYPTPEGFGRLDAVGRIGNFVLGESMQYAITKDAWMKNVAVSDAPVSFPHVWDTPWFDWVQYTASFKSPIVRNGGESMGVFVRVNFDHDASPDSLFQSTMDLGNLYEMEALLRGTSPFAGLRAPEWPEDILGPIDSAAAARGDLLYQENCQRCHLPAFNNPAFMADTTHWVVDLGQRYVRTVKVDTATIGTDLNASRNLLERLTWFDSLSSRMGLPVDSKLAFASALEKAIDSVVARKFDSLDLSQAVRDTISGLRSGLDVQGIPVYKARPLNGVWATPPFLHNGSVPNLYQLLGPESERDSVFWLGTKEFDPVRVGFVLDTVPNVEPFDTGLSGNSNKGHHFTGNALTGGGDIGRALTPDERMDIIEFLKSMPAVPVGSAAAASGEAPPDSVQGGD